MWTRSAGEEEEKRTKVDRMINDASKNVEETVTRLWMMGGSTAMNVKIDFFTLIPRFTIPLSTTNMFSYSKFKIESVKDRSIQHGVYSTLMVGSNAYNYSTREGNWKPEICSLGEFKDEDCVKRFVY
jgi:hypothetical protein